MNRIIAAVSVLLGAAALLGVLLSPPAPADGLLTTGLRAFPVVPGWMLLPGLPWLALWSARRSAASRSFRFDPLTGLIKAAALSLLIQIVNLAVFKLLSWQPDPVVYLALLMVEALPACVLLLWWAPVRVAIPTRREVLMAVVAALLVGAMGARFAGWAARPLESYWYHPRALEQREASPVSLQPQGEWGPATILGQPGGQARVYHPVGTGELSLEAEQAGTTTLLLLLQAEVGASIGVSRAGERLARTQVSRRPTEDEQEGPVLRYFERGITCVIEDIEVEAGDRLVITIDAAPGYLLADLSSASSDAVVALQKAGPSPIHYHQILNLAETQEWGQQALASHYLIIHQPPLWPYVVGPLQLLVGQGLSAAFLFVLLTLLVQALVLMRLVTRAEPGTPVTALLLLLMCVMLQGRLMIHANSINFPDYLYALTIVIGCLALVRSDAVLFGVFGFGSGLLRYPGAVLFTAAALFHGWITGANKRADWHLAVLWALTAGFVLFVLVAGLVSGQLEVWWERIVFENTTEHFHGDYKLLTLVSRIPSFFWWLLIYSGFAPLFALPLAGRNARWLMALGVAYALPIAASDHMSSHYFLPLIALMTAAAACNITVLARRYGQLTGEIIGGVAVLIGGYWLTM